MPHLQGYVRIPASWRRPRSIQKSTKTGRDSVGTESSDDPLRRRQIRLAMPTGRFEPLGSSRTPYQPGRVGGLGSARLRLQFRYLLDLRRPASAGAPIGGVGRVISTLPIDKRSNVKQAESALPADLERRDRVCAGAQPVTDGLGCLAGDLCYLCDGQGGWIQGGYLIGQFAAGSGKKAGEFYTPQPISSILSAIVTLDGQEPATGQRKHMDSVLDFACGSGSLLLNVRHRMGPHGIGKIYGQEKNITTYNLARMNMLLHGVKDSEFDIFHGDTLLNEWDMLRETNPAKMPKFDAVIANPPFSYRWEPTEALSEDVRFKNHGLAPKSAADFAFLLHGVHFLKEDGVMGIILPHGVLFRGGAEARIRTKLLKDGHIDTVIGLPPNLFFSTGIPVCILVLKKCKKPNDVLFINAAEHFEKGKRQNRLLAEHIDKIIDTYRFRKEEARYSRRVSMEEIEKKNDFNLNISRYVSTAVVEEEIELAAVHAELVSLDEKIRIATERHNEFLAELGKPLLP